MGQTSGGLIIYTPVRVLLGVPLAPSQIELYIIYHGGRNESASGLTAVVTSMI